MVGMAKAASMISVEMPDRARHMVIVCVSPILSPNGPPASAPIPYSSDAMVVTRPISAFVTFRLIMMSPSRGGAMTNSEWLTECAAPSRVSLVAFFVGWFIVFHLLRLRFVLVYEVRMVVTCLLKA